MTASAPPALPADLELGLKRLKLRRIRHLAPELLHTAETHRWTPEELLRTLVEAEIAARDEANLATRLRVAAFPVTKTLDDFQLAASSIPPATFAYLASLEWIDAAENTVLVGPPGTGKSHVLIGLGTPPSTPEGGSATCPQPTSSSGSSPGWLTTPSAGSSTPSCATTTWSSTSSDATLDATGSQLLFRFVAAAYERRSLGLASHHPFELWGRFLPEQATATALLDRFLHHPVVVATDGESFRMRKAKTRITAPPSRR